MEAEISSCKFDKEDDGGVSREELRELIRKHARHRQPISQEEREGALLFGEVSQGFNPILKKATGRFSKLSTGVDEFVSMDIDPEKVDDEKIRFFMEVLGRFVDLREVIEPVALDMGQAVLRVRKTDEGWRVKTNQIGDKKEIGCKPHIIEREQLRKDNLVLVPELDGDKFLERFLRRYRGKIENILATPFPDPDISRNVKRDTIMRGYGKKYFDRKSVFDALAEVTGSYGFKEINDPAEINTDQKVLMTRLGSVLMRVRKDRVRNNDGENGNSRGFDPKKDSKYWPLIMAAVENGEPAREG